MDDWAVRARVTGRVQGVGYRAWTAQEARRLGLAGWVRNEADGAVVAQLEGTRAAVEAMVAALERGPAFSAVRAVEVEPVAGEGCSEFRIAR